ncbi:MAG: hypothetical protein R2827_13685 [Bdellovibrionales bacterium]
MLKFAAICVTLCLFIVPFVPNSPYALAWDDTFFVHRSISIVNGAWGGEFSRVYDAIGAIHKSPIMPIVSLPLGPVDSVNQMVTHLRLGVLMLALLCSAMLIYMLLCIKTHPIGLLIFAVAIAANQYLMKVAGQLMVDSFSGSTPF